MLHEHNTFEVFELKNLTSDLNLMNSENQVEVVLCEQNVITFQAPSFSGSMDQLVLMKGALKTGAESSIDFTIVGKIIGLKSVGEPAQQQITIKMNQYSKKDWDYFISQLETKQKRVDHILESLKGDE
ncbi:MAG: hypothetical protein JNL11_14005 [Bdellovibrionaceae bacterium]|nr:hypothetical protein [Pseudobdellovibrionaceae bacterium]